MSFNLLMGTKGGQTFSGTRQSGDMAPVLTLAPTHGTFRLNAGAVSFMRLVDGDRIVVAEAIDNLGGSIKVPYGVISNPEGSPARFSKEQEETTFLIFKGRKSNADALAEEFASANPYYGIEGTQEEKVAHRTEWMQRQTAFVKAELAARNLQNDDELGNTARFVGMSLNFSSKASWTMLGGDEDKSTVYAITGTTYFGIKVNTAGVASLVTLDTVEEDGSAYLIIDAANGSEKNLWKQVSSLAEVKAATPFYTLEFKTVKDKNERNAAGTDSADAAEETAEIMEDLGFEEV